jgi:KaiC/GvpD/RAD55 family RecA-like ATPase
VVDGRALGVQVGTLAIGSLLLEHWPTKGGRHEAYLALAGGLLRFGDGVHPWWEKALPILIAALADGSRDEDGASARVSEVMGTTLRKLQGGGKAVGFPRLGEIIGNDNAELVRRWAKDVEALAGFAGVPIRRLDATTSASDEDAEPEGPLVSTLPPEERNPLEERTSSWGMVDLEPYLTGQVVMPSPGVLERTDERGLFYPGRVNSLFGASESAKSWIATYACLQEIARGNRVVYVDLEDMPEGMIERLLALGASADDLTNLFRYVHPEGPLAEMQRYRFGHQPTADGLDSSSVFQSLLTSFDPTLIIVDGMTVLYGLHGHDTNEATGTDVITSWLKLITRAGRTTVVVIDHTGKTSGAGSSPIGAHHKVAMVQGTALRVDVVDRPRRGALGHMKLIVFKDRPGAVRQFATDEQEQVAGDVFLDSTEPGISRMRIDPPNPDDVVIGNSDRMDRKLGQLAKVQEVADAAVELFGGDPDVRVTTPMVSEKTGADYEEVRTAWEHLERTGKVQRYGVGKGTYYLLALAAD